MADTRHKDVNWCIHNNSNGTVPSSDAHLAVLMDLRDELKGIRGHLSALQRLARCPNVQRGFIAMNKTRLLLERKWPAAAKPRKRK